MASFMDDLRAATADLWYTSETDAPVEPFHWPAEQAGTAPPAPERVRELAGLPAGAPVKTLTLEAFFAPLTQQEDWYGDEERETARRFQALEQLLRDRLQSPAVYRIGETRIDLMVVGNSPEGGLAGVRTQAVET